MISKQAIVDYYADKTDGIHRYNSEAFYQAEAREKLFHIGHGDLLLDFGCGTADLLVYYAPHFSSMIGVDVSENMVSRAHERLTKFGVANAVIRQADETTVWQVEPAAQFDIVTSAGVMQYLTASQIGSFLADARGHLMPNGRVVLFDLVDPRLYWLFKYGWFKPVQMNAAGAATALMQTAKVLARKVVRGVAGKPEDHIGYAHHPAAIAEQAERSGYRVDFVCSMYYEYRYHALLRPAA